MTRNSSPIAVLLLLFSTYGIMVAVDCALSAKEVGRLQTNTALRKVKLQDYPAFTYMYMRKYAAHTAELGDCMVKKGAWTEADKEEQVETVKAYQGLKHVMGTDPEVKAWLRSMNEDAKIRKFVESVFNGVMAFMECQKYIPDPRDELRTKP